MRWYNLEVSPILDEVEPPLGVTLWQRWRDVYLWCLVLPEERAGLFAEHGSEIRLPLHLVDPAGEKDLSRALRDFAYLTAYPERVDAETVAQACITVADWAYQRGCVVTEELFAELAARVRPEDADLALYAGRVARRKADFARAVQWFRRALRLARLANDPAARISGYLSWGILEEQRGNIDDARKFFTKAWRAARRAKLRRSEAAARQNLLVMYDSLTVEEGQEHAVAALRGYGPHDERIPALAHDTATLWLWHGYFDVALPLLQKVLPSIERQGERVQIVANLARAAGALDMHDLFMKCWTEVERYARKREENTAAALVNLARGARSLRMEHSVRDLANRALALATRRNEPGPAAAALQLLESRPSERDPVRPATPSMTALAQRFHSILDQRAASAR